MCLAVCSFSFCAHHRLLEKSIDLGSEQLIHGCLNTIDAFTEDVIFQPGFLHCSVEALERILERDGLRIEEVSLVKRVFEWLKYVLLSFRFVQTF